MDNWCRLNDTCTVKAYTEAVPIIQYHTFNNINYSKDSLKKNQCSSLRIVCAHSKCEFLQYVSCNPIFY